MLRMDGHTQANRNADAISMFISAAIFGFFGFFYFTSSQTLLLFQIVLWTLRGGAAGFALAGVLTLVAPAIGRVLFFLVSAVTVALFAVTGIWHFVDPAVSNLNGVLLLLFAVWNGASLARSIRAG
ncbi:MAG: hypothetical protein ACF8PN_11235 [Phycisphaerales bacterium]